MTGLPVSGPAAGRYIESDHAALMAVPLWIMHAIRHVVLDLGCTRPIRSRLAIKRFPKHAWYYGITSEFCRCNNFWVFSNSETETCLENCFALFIFQQVQPLLTCLRKVMYLFCFRFLRWQSCERLNLFSLPQMTKLQMKVARDYSTWSSKKTRLHAQSQPVFHSSIVFRNGTYCVAHDEFDVSAYETIVTHRNM